MPDLVIKNEYVTHIPLIKNGIANFIFFKKKGWLNTTLMFILALKCPAVSRLLTSEIYMEKEFIVYRLFNATTTCLSFIVYLMQLQPVRSFESKHCIIHSP